MFSQNSVLCGGSIMSCLLVNMHCRLLQHSCTTSITSSSSHHVLLFLVVLDGRSCNTRLDDGVRRHVTDVELEFKLVGDIFDGERACLVAVECHGSKLEFTSGCDVIPDIQQFTYLLTYEQSATGYSYTKVTLYHSYLT